MYTALRLLKKLKPGEARVTVVDPRSYMTYQPFLPEAAAGSLVAAPRRRAAAPGAAQGRGHHRARHQVDHVAQVATRRSRSRASRTTLDVRHPRRRRRVDRAHAADPGPGRERDRLQDRRGGDRRAQPRHRVAWTSPRARRDPARARARADLRRRRRRLRRHRGARRARGHGALRDALLRHDRAERPALRAGRGDRPDPARGRRGPGPLHRRRCCASAASTSGSNTRLESCVDGHVVLSDGSEFDADTILWTAGVKADPVLRDDRPAARRARAGQGDRRTCGSRASRTRGPRATAPRCPTSPASPASSARPTAQHAVRQAAHLGDNIVARAARPGDHRRTSTSTSARSRASGCTRASRRSTASSSRGFPAWFMHRTYHVSRVPDLQPQGPRDRRLDAGAALPARGRLALVDPRPGGRVREGGPRRHRQSSPVTAARARRRSAVCGAIVGAR